MSVLYAQLKQVRPAKLSNKHLSKRHKTVHRVYGGCLDHKVVRERYAVRTYQSNCFQSATFHARHCLCHSTN